MQAPPFSLALPLFQQPGGPRRYLPGGRSAPRTPPGLAARGEAQAHARGPCRERGGPTAPALLLGSRRAQCGLLCQL